MISRRFSGWGFCKDKTPPGIVLISYCWGILRNSAGDGKNFGERDLPWLLAEDNPVISLCEE